MLIARNPTRTRAFLNLAESPVKLAREVTLLLDKSKLPADLWVRMMWAPNEGSEPDDRPIVLITDRRRWKIGLVPAVLGILLLSALILARAPVVVLLLPMAVIVASARYGGGGQSGYYEVNADGGLGDFLGRRVPPVLRDMHRTKS